MTIQEYVSEMLTELEPLRSQLNIPLYEMVPKKWMERQLTSIAERNYREKGDFRLSEGQFNKLILEDVNDKYAGRLIDELLDRGEIQMEVAPDGEILYTQTKEQ